MSATAPEPVATPPAPTGPSGLTRAAAVAVIVALAALAYYSLFSGPTTVPVPGATNAAPRHAAPTGEDAGPEPREEGRGD